MNTETTLTEETLSDIQEVQRSYRQARGAINQALRAVLKLQADFGLEDDQDEHTALGCLRNALTQLNSDEEVMIELVTNLG